MWGNDTHFLLWKTLDWHGKVQVKMKIPFKLHLMPTLLTLDILPKEQYNKNSTNCSKLYPSHQMCPLGVFCLFNFTLQLIIGVFVRHAFDSSTQTLLIGEPFYFIPCKGAINPEGALRCAVRPCLCSLVCGVELGQKKKHGEMHHPMSHTHPQLYRRWFSLNTDNKKVN